MKKIKKFKISLNKRAVASNLKVSAGIKELTLKLEELIETEIRRAESYITPEAVFDTLQPMAIEQELPLDFDKSSPVIGTSLIIATIGARIEQEAAAFQEKGEHIASQVINAIAIEGMHATANFIYKLLREEAEKEDCELLPLETTADTAVKSKMISLLSADKLNIALDPQNCIHPSYTAFCLARWKPKKKSRQENKKK